MLIMYGDYEYFQSANTCCLIKVAQQQLSASFRGNGLSFIFRHFPQMQIHLYAQRAGEAAEEAAQGQFWPMHDYPEVYINRIHADIEGRLRSGVEAAPALFINGIRYTDRWTIEQIVAAIVAVDN